MKTKLFALGATLVLAAGVTVAQPTITQSLQITGPNPAFRVTLAAPTLTGGYSLFMPTAQPTAGQFLRATSVTGSDIQLGWTNSGLANGTVDNSTLRWDAGTTSWVENTAVTATSAGLVTANKLTLNQLDTTASSAVYVLTVPTAGGGAVQTRNFTALLTSNLPQTITVSGASDEDYAIKGEITNGSNTQQYIGIWGDASNTGTSNRATIGVLATGNGITGSPNQQNIALQLNDGRFAMGRTTETGTGYTVVEPAADGVAYSEEGPSGVIEIVLGPAGLNADVLANQTRIYTRVVKNRYATSDAIILANVIANTNAGGDPDPEDAAFSVTVDARTQGEFTLRIAITGRNGLDDDDDEFTNSDKIRIGYLIVSPGQ